MTIEDTFFSQRRSVTAKKMSQGLIDKEDLKIILEAGVRVPDHGALNPWKLVVIQGNSLKKIDEEKVYQNGKCIYLQVPFV